jgi:hypothetical protein
MDDSKTQTSLTVRVYPVLSRAIEEGVRCGLNRGFKYSDKPTREDLAEQIEREVMNALGEVFDLDA